MELYKKYRPKTLARMIGNKATVSTLINMLERGTLPHTLLFTGPSGCGKTTLARILIRELGCSDVDFKELNCSDFRGVDTIREIARTMTMAPTGGEVRIWLLDEVHQMTKDAQNAALKIFEDTPRHVYFFLCTTDPQKLIATIKTRCCQIPVEPLSPSLISALITRVCKKEEIELPNEEIIPTIADASEGSARKALVILDSIRNLPAEQMLEGIKDVEQSQEVIDLCRALIKGESWSKVTKILKELKEEPENIRYAILGYASSCLLAREDKRAAMIIEVFSDNFYDSKKAGLILACYEVICGM